MLSLCCANKHIREASGFIKKVSKCIIAKSGQLDSAIVHNISYILPIVATLASRNRLVSLYGGIILILANSDIAVL